MAFDSEQWADREGYPCPIKGCNGSVEEIKPGVWECSKCDFKHDKKERGEDV